MSSDLPDGLLNPDGDQEGGGSTASDTDEQSFERYTIVSIGTHRFALPVSDVDTVINRQIELTLVPRTPEAIEGVTDIRGQITTIVDPHVHFPDSGGPSASPSLLAFADRQQPAATWVDEVEGVEAVPEDDVIDQSTYEPEAIEGTALEHPLIVGAIRVERRSRDAVMESVAGTQALESRDQSADQNLREEPIDRSETDDGEVVVGEFSLDEENDRSGEREQSPQSRSDDVEVEVTPILDVDRFLLAAGRIGDERDPVTDTVDVEAGTSDPADSSETDDTIPKTEGQEAPAPTGETDPESDDVDESESTEAEANGSGQEPVTDETGWPDPITGETDTTDSDSSDDDAADSESLSEESS